MPRPGNNHLDRTTLTLTPRAYLHDPHGFGRPGPARWFVPPGGTQAGLRTARRQHVLACRWAETRTPKTGQIRQTYGISKQTWSRIVRGERWAGQLGLEVLLDAWH
jgi:hypothetical protein